MIHATHQVKVQHVIKECVASDDNFVISLLTKQKRIISINANPAYAIVITSTEYAD